MSQRDRILTFEVPATTAAARWPWPKDATRRSFPLNGERRLLLAVLEDAVETFQRYLTASDRRDHALFVDVAAWFASEDTQWMFSFVPICDALGFDVEYFRSGLRRWRDMHCPSLEAEPLDRLSFHRMNAVRHRANRPANGMLRHARTASQTAASPRCST